MYHIILHKQHIFLLFYSLSFRFRTTTKQYSHQNVRWNKENRQKMSEEKKIGTFETMRSVVVVVVSQFECVALCLQYKWMKMLLSDNMIALRSDIRCEEAVYVFAWYVKVFLVAYQTDRETHTHREHRTRYWNVLNAHRLFFRNAFTHTNKFIDSIETG